jgi:positive regulator of sigma E activity
MGSFLIHSGMFMAVVGALLMAAARILGSQLFTWDRHLLVGGVVLMVVGFFLRGRQRDRRWWHSVCRRGRWLG